MSQNILTWSEQTARGGASYEDKVFGITAKPVLSFEYDGLYYEVMQKKLYYDSQWVELTEAQITEIEAFIEKAYNDYGNKVLGVDSNGYFLGYVAPSQAAAIVPIAPPTTTDRWKWNSVALRWNQVLGVDKNGVYLGWTHVEDTRFYAEVDAPPSQLYETWDFKNKVWADQRTVEDFRVIQSKVVSDACQVQILAGFKSSALGSEYSYPSQMTDQQNLASSILDSLLNASNPDWVTPFWCEDANGTWAFVNHTAAQIQQVGKDGKTAILVAMSKNQHLQAQIQTATTADAVNAITW